MRAIAVLLFLIGTLVFFLSSSPSYYNCSGTKTENGTTNEEIVQNISFKVNVVSWLNGLIFNSQNKGSAFFDSNRHYLHISSVSDINVILKSATGGRAFAVFDRVSRRLILNDGNSEFNVVCRSVEPGAV